MSLKEQAMKFQLAITPNIKKIIEEVLDAVDPCSCYSGDKAFDTLKLTIGVEPATFLKKLLDLYNADEIQSGEEISEETRGYINYLYGKYAYKLRGLLSGRVWDRPDEWVQINWISHKYDLGSKELLLKFSVQKTNKECLIIEDTYGNLLTLAKHIITRICDSPGIDTYKNDIYINKNDIESIIKSAMSLNEKMFGVEKKEG
jgi:hypothetical protein